MKQTRISQEPLFMEYSPIEARFVPFQKSVIWRYNDVFWKHCQLWEDTYHEDYEKSLPSNVPYSHKPGFIKDSARRFFTLLERLQENGELPERIIVIEQGPGSGVYAKGFLDKLKTWSTPQQPFYDRITYVLSDMSVQILQNAQEALGAHKEHVETYQQPAYRSIPKQYLHKALLVRHGNMWDQFPCQMLKVGSQAVHEVQTKAVLDTGFAKYLKDIPYASFPQFSSSLRNGMFETLITQHPYLWKPLIRNIRLEMRMKEYSAFSYQRLPYRHSLETVAKQTKGDEEILFSQSVITNLLDMHSLIDWKRGGYIEVVDIIARSFSHLRKRRRPLKFDGAVAVFINGPLIKDFMRTKGKYVGLSKLKHLNTVASIQDYNLEQVLGSKNFVTLAEVAAKQDEKKSIWVEKVKTLLDMQLDFVTFSDRAHGWNDFVPVEGLLGAKIYEKLEPRTLLQVFATRRKTKEQIEDLIPKLKQQGIQNLFVVTGDSGEYDVSDITSIDALPLLSKYFYTGAVAKPDIADIPKLLRKIDAGAKFFIVQSTYNAKKWEEWVREIKRKNLHKKAHFIQSLIPIVSKKTLQAILAFPDVPVSEDIQTLIMDLPDEQVAEKGRGLAKDLVKTYKQTGIFSGVYIFSKSFKVIGDMVDAIQA